MFSVFLSHTPKTQEAKVGAGGWVGCGLWVVGGGLVGERKKVQHSAATGT